VYLAYGLFAFSAFVIWPVLPFFSDYLREFVSVNPKLYIVLQLDLLVMAGVIIFQLYYTYLFFKYDNILRKKIKKKLWQMKIRDYF